MKKILVTALSSDGDKVVFEIYDDRSTEELDKAIIASVFDDEDLKITKTDGVEIIINKLTKFSYIFTAIG